MLQCCSRATTTSICYLSLVKWLLIAHVGVLCDDPMPPLRQNWFFTNSQWSRDAWADQSHWLDASYICYLALSSWLTQNPVKHTLRTLMCWFLHQCVHLRATFPPPLRRPPGPNSMFQIHHDFGFLLFYFSWDLSCRAHDLIAYITNFSVKCTSLYTASHHSELTSTSLFLVEYISLISLFGTFSCSCSAQKLEQFAGCRWPIFRWSNEKY